MKVEFQRAELAQMESDPGNTRGWPLQILRGYCKVLNLVRQVDKWPDLYTFKSLRLEKLKGKRKDQYSMRINNQYRLIVEFGKEERHDIITIIGIEDYHG